MAATPTGHFVDTTEEPDYLRVGYLESDADVGVLQSKEWFEWARGDHMPVSTLASPSRLLRPSLLPPPPHWHSTTRTMGAGARDADTSRVLADSSVCFFILLC